MNISIHSCKYCKWAYKIIWNCAINIASCFVWEGIKDIWGLGVSLGSDFNLPWNWSYNIAIYVQIPKFENWITWFMGTCISYKWCLKNPSTCKYECNQTQGGGRIGDRPVYRKWSVYTHINKDSMKQSLIHSSPKQQSPWRWNSPCGGWLDDGFSI